MSNGPADPFARACGLAGSFLVELEGPGSDARSTLEFRQPFLVVGRDPLSDLTIDDPEVAPRHAYLQVIAGRVFCLNLGGRSGIHWDEGPRQASWVDGRNGIRIGPVRLRFGGLEIKQGGSLPITEDFDWPTESESYLEFLDDDTTRKPWAISRALSLVGSSPTCRVHLPGSGVGRIHAAFVRTPTGVWVVDLLGPGGMTVREISVRQALLETGDEIVIGPHRLRFRLGPVPEPVPGTNLARFAPVPSVQPVAMPVVPPSSPSLIIDSGDSAVSKDVLAAPLDWTSANKLLEEFDRMHQRTVDQFQQAIMLMFQMHQEQMDSVRDELSRLDRLEEEQKFIRVELARNNASQPTTPRMDLRKDIAEGPPSSTHPRSRISPEAMPGSDEIPSWNRPPEPTIAPEPSPILAPVSAPEARVAEPSPPPTNGHHPSTNGHHPATNGHHPAGPATAPPPLQSDPDPHSRLARRIAEIQDERQSLWRRIMASLSGDTSEMRLP
jgi:pSer/pThr/pTyr-binding forkhead associated (FHA) protein